MEEVKDVDSYRAHLPERSVQASDLCTEFTEISPAMVVKVAASGGMELLSTEENSKAEYRYVTVRAPRLAGFPLKCFTWFLETGMTSSLILPKLKKDNLITKTLVESKYDEPPMYIPQFPREAARLVQEQMVLQVQPDTVPTDSVVSAVRCLPPQALDKVYNEVEDKQYSFRHWTIRDYAQAYISGRLTPIQVAERFISAVEDSQNQGMNLFSAMDSRDVLAQAAESAARYKKGQPLSVLDGVPFAVKDEIDCLPYATTGGTTWLGEVRQTKDDAQAVKCLRSCGAVMVGKTNMHELGMGTTGINPHYGYVNSNLGTRCRLAFRSEGFGNLMCDCVKCVHLFLDPRIILSAGVTGRCWMRRGDWNLVFVPELVEGTRQQCDAPICVEYWQCV